MVEAAKRTYIQKKDENRAKCIFENQSKLEVKDNLLWLLSW